VHEDAVTPPDDDLALALSLADIADALSLDRFGTPDLVVSTKRDDTHVTDADTRVEQAIRATLAENRPGDSVLGEEYGSAGTAARQWIIDPIDGTANFLRGVPVWGTLIALALEGRPVLGVVSAPALGSRWWATTGQGAWTAKTGERTSQMRRLAVSGVTDLADASLSYNNLKGWDEAGHLNTLVALSRGVWRTRAYGDMWSYMLVAEGLIDIAAEFDVQPYDIAAIIPIVEEAGGRFTSIDGQDGPWGGSALATNGLLHDAVREIVAGVSKAKPGAI
jgi:histidinol-phosphatase